MKVPDPSPPGGAGDRHRHLQPFQICPGPAALPIVQNLYAQGLLEGARILPFQG